MPNALEQARSVAATVAGRHRPYTAAPWFWCDQYDLKLQAVGLQHGLQDGHDMVALRGDPSSRSFLVAYVKDGRIIATDAISRPREFAQARKLVSSAAEVAADAIADERLSRTRLLQPVA